MLCINTYLGYCDNIFRYNFLKSSDSAFVGILQDISAYRYFSLFSHTLLIAFNSRIQRFTEIALFVQSLYHKVQLCLFLRQLFRNCGVLFGRFYPCRFKRLVKLR